MSSLVVTSNQGLQSKVLSFDIESLEMLTMLMDAALTIARDLPPRVAASD